MSIIDDSILQAHPFDISDVQDMILVAEGSLGAQVLKGTWHTFTIAIKRVPFDAIMERQQLKQREYEFIQQNQEYLKTHENILPCYGYQISNNNFYYMYPLMDTDLFDVVVNHTIGKVSDAQKWSWIVVKNATGLQHFHDNNLYHGDVRVSNILMDQSGTSVKICDFGLAKNASKAPAHATLHYLAPEAIQSVDWSSRADVFSFGMLVMEIFTEDLLFDISMDENSMHAQITSESWKSKIDQVCTAKVASLVKWCCDNDKTKRPTMQQVINYVGSNCYSAQEFCDAGEYETSCLFAEMFHDNIVMEKLAMKKFQPAIALLLNMSCTNETAFAIGVWFYNGTNGCQQNYAVAAKWFDRDISQENANLQNNIGMMYYTGDGAMRAQNNIGNLYYNGQGVQQDYIKATEWYIKAANQGDASAQYNIGMCYDNGEGVEQDYIKAMEWYMKSANHDNATAQNNIGMLYDSGQGVAQDYIKAMEWFTKAANQSHANAQYNIGVLYKHGRGVSKNILLAIEWFKKAHAQGDADATDQLQELNALYSN